MQSSRIISKKINIITELLQVIDVLVTEVHPHHRGDATKAITLDTSFEKDLGLDSLTRVELISRVEKNSSWHCLNKPSPRLSQPEIYYALSRAL